MSYLNGPRAITRGMSLCYDAANHKSYYDSGTSWRDLGNIGSEGVLTNGPTYSSDNGGVIIFDGVNDYVVGPSNSSLYTTDVTAEAWIKINSSIGDWVRVVGTGGNSGNRTFGLWYSIDRRLLWQRYGAGDPSLNPTNVIPLSTWSHIVATTSGTSHALYLNGSLIGTASGTGPWPASNESITVGYSGFHASINGVISMVKLYTTALTATEVLQNYNTTKGRFGL